MKHKTLTFYSKIISFILVLLGFTACDEDESTTEYGVPATLFKISGTVVSKDGEKPIKDIRVVLGENKLTSEGKNDILYGDTLYTDNNGKFLFDTYRHSYNNAYLIKLQDIDGEENGSFSEFKQEIEVKEGEIKDLGTIKLTPVKKEETE